MDYNVILEDVINESFSQYAGAVIQSRALVDVRDCVKPSARQIYYALYKDGFTSEKPFKKTLKAIGTAFKYYIHGDASCEGIIMRSGQPFSMRYPLVEIEGSYGNQTETGNWAASRYTSSRLSALANYLIQETDEYSIDEWIDNYDDTAQYPRVLSSLGFYNIVNGSFGIAVGLASSIPQFNLKEVNNALITLLQKPDIEDDKIICLPDFATGGIIINEKEVIESLKQGAGKAAIIQAKIEYDKKENCLIVVELPYGVYTNTICSELEKLAQKDDNFGIVRINDLTGEQVHMKLYLAKSVDPKQMTDYLYQNTSLQSSYSINMTMLENGRFPKVYGWKAALQAHLVHEEQVYIRVYEHELKNFKYKLKIISGIIKAIQNIEQVIQTIKESETTSTANSALQTLLNIDKEQARAILDMRLSRLTKLDIEDLLEKRDRYMAHIRKIETILDNTELLHQQMIIRFKEVASKFGDNRRTQVIQKNILPIAQIKKEKTAEPVVICYTANGYIKSVPAAKYREVDGNLGCIKTMTDDYIQIYNTNKVYRLKVDKIKQCLASEKGVALGTILGTGLTHIRYIAANNANKEIIAISKTGRVKKLNTSLFNGTTQNIKGQDYFPKNEVVFLTEATIPYLRMNTKDRKLTIDLSVLKTSGKSSTGRVGIKLLESEQVSSVDILQKQDAYFGTIGTKGRKI